MFDEHSVRKSFYLKTFFLYHVMLLQMFQEKENDFNQIRGIPEKYSKSGEVD